MSLSRAMLRLITVQALTGATLAGDRVSDSKLDAIDHRASTDPLPEVVVYTDDHESTTDGRAAMLAAESTCDLVIEIVVTGNVTVTIDGPDNEPIQTVERIILPSYDESLALTLDILERQVIAALVASEGGWARLWRDFVPKVHKRLSRQGGAADQAMRYAARQIVLSVDLLHEPAPGVVLPAGSTWLRALDALDDIEPLAKFVRLIRAEIDDGDRAQWRVDAGSLGVNTEVIDDLGDGPAGTAVDPVPLVDVTADRDGSDPVAVDGNILRGPDD